MINHISNINLGQYCKFGNFREGFIFAKLRIYAKYRENKILAKYEITLLITDIGKSCPSRKFLKLQVCLNAICENKILTKIS